MDEKVLRDIMSRLEKLERAVFRSGKVTASKTDKDAKKYKGATGGIRLLADEGYFDKKRAFGDICKALENKGYHYTKQAVQTPLNNLSSSKKKWTSPVSMDTGLSNFHDRLELSR